MTILENELRSIEFTKVGAGETVLIRIKNKEMKKDVYYDKMDMNDLIGLIISHDTDKAEADDEKTWKGDLNLQVKRVFEKIDAYGGRTFEYEYETKAEDREPIRDDNGFVKHEATALRDIAQDIKRVADQHALLYTSANHEVSGIKERLDLLEGRIADHDGQIGEADRNVTVIRGDVGNIRDVIGTLRSKVSELQSESLRTLPVSRGGTGAVTIEGARRNLGIKEN